MWKFLRKHLNVEDTEFILRALQEQEKQTWRDEALRRQYLRLYDECKHFDPQWEDTEMKRRRQRVDNKINSIKCPVDSSAPIDDFEEKDF